MFLVIETRFTANIIKEGSIVIDSKLFGDIIRKLPDEDIRIKADAELNMSITCKKIKFNLIGKDPKAYPSFADVISEMVLRTKQYIIKDMINQTIFSVGDDDDKPYLSGVYMECGSGIITFVSIDGFRLALRTVNVDDVNSEFNVIVPGESLSEISKILSDNDDDLFITSDEKNIEFKTANTKITSKLIEGKYADYRNFIPEEYQCEIILNTREIRDCIERAMLVVYFDKMKQPVLIEIKDDILVLSANTVSGSGMIKEEINIQAEGRDLEIKFNPKYFLDVLRVIEEDQIKIKFSSEVGPCIIKNIDRDNYLYMILPLRRN